MRRAYPLAFAALFVASCNSCKKPVTSGDSDCWTPQKAGSGAVDCRDDSEHEPNDTLSAANRVADATCDEQRIAGAVGDEVDVFRASGKRCDKGPSAVLYTDVPSIRLCLVVACKKGKTALPGCQRLGEPAGPGADAPIVSTKGIHLPEGALGCCRSGAGPVDVSLVACDSEQATVALAAPSYDTYYIVDNAPSGACTKYQIGYRY